MSTPVIDLSNMDKPSVGTTLILAGFIPSFSWFDSTHLSAIYFSLLIPPAAYHCYSWFKKTAVPNFKDILNSLLSSDKKSLVYLRVETCQDTSVPDKFEVLAVDSSHSLPENVQSQSDLVQALHEKKI